MKETPSTFTLEQYLLKELPSAELRRLEALIQADPDLQKRIAELEASNQTILRDFPPSKISQNISERFHKPDPASPETLTSLPKRNRRLLSWLTPVLVLPLALIVFWNPFFRNDSGGVSSIPQLEDGVRMKGASELFLHRKSSSTAAGEGERLKADVLLRSGDFLQISYLSTGDKTGILFSVDEGGALTRHFPPMGKNADLAVGKKTALPEIYELDDTPGTEIFFFITSPKDFDSETVFLKAKSLNVTSEKSLDAFRSAFPGLHITTFRIRKPQR